MIPPSDLLPPPAARAAAAELSSLATAIAALSDVGWRSPAADAYRTVVGAIARDTAALATALATGAPT